MQDFLPGGMQEKALRAAIDLSGYPLQTVVAGSLADREYLVEEEWAWRDEEQETQRTLDILAEWSNRSWSQSELGRIQVIRSLLIECKQSRNPYLGFAAVSPPLIERHPRIVGLRHHEIAIQPEGGGASYRLLLHRALGLRGHPYLREPLVVSSLSRAHGNGKRVQMSGDEPFNSLVKPLTKAARMFWSHWHAPQRPMADPSVVRLIFPIAIIDAPLFAVKGRRGASEIHPVDWMRVFTRHAAGPSSPRRRLGFDVVDLVTIDYFETFLTEYLEPFADEFVSSLARIQDCVLAGGARLPGYEPGEPLPFDLLARLRPLAP